MGSTPFVAGLSIILMVLAGCASNVPDATAPPSSPTTPTPPSPAPLEVLNEERNNQACTDVLTEGFTGTFTVPENYTRVEIAWHATGTGQVGYEIRDGNDTVLASRPDENPGTGCTHNHGPSTMYDAAPGDFDVTVRSTGLVYWQLVVIAHGPAGNASHEDH